MARVAIIGAEPAGTQLALALLQYGDEVTLVVDRKPEEIRAGNVLSGQCMFGSSLALEREFGVDWWSNDTPDIRSITFSSSGETPYNWSAPLTSPAKSVDLRLKSAAWIERFVDAGGQLLKQAVDIASLEGLASTHDLVLVATGRGELGRLFAPDSARSRFDRPQRVLALAYVHGMRPRDDGNAISFSQIPGVGDYFTFPALTTTGPCDVMVFSGVPGGAMDCWEHVTDPDQHLARSLELLERFVPSEFERCVGVSLTDRGAVLRSRLAPYVKAPVGKLPSGRPVMGIGDAVVLVDPLAGQGANLAAQAASHYLDNIVRNRSGQFDESWMHKTHENFWRGCAHWTVDWADSLLSASPQQAQLLREAADDPALAAAIANGYDDPREFFPWWFTADAAPRLRGSNPESTQPRIDPRELRRTLGQFATGVTVVTARCPSGQKVGMTANSFTSVSMDPPLVLWCPSKNAPSLPQFAEATHFAVNVLSSEQEALARRFSTPAPDKFAELELVEGAGGTPILPGSLARFECRTVQCIEAGDHIVFIGEVERFSTATGTPLIFHAGALRPL